MRRFRCVELLPIEGLNADTLHGQLDTVLMGFACLILGVVMLVAVLADLLVDGALFMVEKVKKKRA